eukprot:2870348-Pyramimonas_sp.AAC.1
MGTDLARGNVCVAPDLQDWVAQKLAKDASAMEERRKAREERSANRQKGQKKNGKDGKGERG